MDAMSLDTLSPEEIDALEKAIAGRKQGADDPISTLASIVQSLMERLGRIEEDFYTKVLGGIDGLYKENMRAEDMKGFGEKYGGMFSPYADDFKRTYSGDLMEKAFDYLESLKGEEGYTDEVGDGKLKELVDQIKGRLTKPEAVAVEVKAEGEPVKLPEAAAPAEEGESDDSESVYDEIARMKKRDGARKRAG